MSSRVMKKLGLEKAVDESEKDVNAVDDEIEINYRNREKYNRYNLLVDNTHSESEVLENENPDIVVEDTNKRRRVKKRKKKNICRENDRNVAKISESNDEDEIERSIREVQELFTKVKGNTSHHRSDNGLLESEMIVLKIEPRHLNPNNELKRMFGPKVINASNEQRKKIRSRTIRGTSIVSQKSTWPPVHKQGISMKLIEKKNNFSYFTFEHSYHYQTVQKDFLSAVVSLTPDDIVRIINEYPYHVDALIQLSELCKIGEDHAMAAELNERAIFALESAFHPSFNVCRGDCRLSYLRQENRSFYVAVLKHVQFVGQRACYRTALELCKMLLSFNPLEDPLAIILCIDYYALRAKEYHWFIEFTSALNATRQLLKLPNFKYSIALAHFFLNDFHQADICLKEALILFPSMLMALVTKCGIHLDGPVSSHSFFTSLAEATETKPLKCLTALYAERCHHLWKNSRVLPWLESNVKEVISMVEAQHPQINDYQIKRMNWFHPTLPVNIKRHLVICDLTDVLILAGEGLPNITLHFDPYPPTNSVNLYSVPRRTVSRGEVTGASRRNGILASFFQALNPNMRYEGPDENELDELAEEIGEVNQELRRSLRSIVNSVRDLLTSFDTDNGDRSSVNQNEASSAYRHTILEDEARDSETSDVDTA